MKPRLDHKVKRSFTYHTARETNEPGYLAARFEAIRRAQKASQTAATGGALDQAEKVRSIRRKEREWKRSWF